MRTSPRGTSFRVVHGEPVDEDVGRRVHDAIDALAPPPYLTELVTWGWRSVDRRLARLEENVARLEAGRDARSEAEPFRLDEAAGTTLTE